VDISQDFLLRDLASEGRSGEQGESQSTVKNAGVPFSSDRITVNWPPADVKKKVRFDLSHGVGILAATGIVPKILRRRLILESFPGRLIRPIKGSPMAMAAKKTGFLGFSCRGEAAEAAVVEGVAVTPSSRSNHW